MADTITRAELKRRFTHHVPDSSRAERHGSVRHEFYKLAEWLIALPEGREKALAFTKLEEAANWAHAAIAREGK